MKSASGYLFANPFDEGDSNMAKPALIPASPKAVIYARVSSKEQEREGFSIPAQLKLLREYAERKGLPILQEYTDVETAKKSGRTQFSDMVKFFKAEGRKKKDPGCRILLVEKRIAFTGTSRTM